MPVNITDVDTFTSPIVAVADGDAVAAASDDPSIQGLANRTRRLWNVLCSPAGNDIDVPGDGGGATVTAVGVVTGNGLKAKPSGNGSTTLDGYRVGTFTPALATLGVNNVSHSTQQGSYVRIGKLVLVTFRLEGNTGVGSTGPIYISGLPYAPNAVFIGAAEFTTANCVGANYGFTAILEGQDGAASAVPYPNHNAGTTRDNNIGAAFVANQLFGLSGSLAYMTDAAF